MKIIDRYVYTVTKRLLEKDRREVEENLRESIDDMLPDNYTEADVEETLVTLGNPALLAEKYRDTPHSLIGPALYNNYLSVLKIVLIVVVCSAPLMTFLSLLTAEPVENGLNLVVTFFVQILAFIFEAAFQAFAWVTVLFAVMDRVNSPYFRWPYTGKEWTLSDLDDTVPSKKNEIGKSDPIVSIIFTLLFITVFGFFPQLIGGYMKLENGWNIIPLFNLDALRQYLPLLLVSAGLSLMVDILKLIYQKWNRTLAIINAAVNVFSIGVLIAFLLNRSIFNDQFHIRIAQLLETDPAVIVKTWQWGVWGIVAVAILFGMIVDSISGFRKAAR